MQKISLFVIRVFAFGLCLLSLEKAWAGVSLYQAQRVLLKQDLGAAIPAFERAKKLDASNPQLLYGFGQTLYQMGMRRGEKVWFLKAEQMFEPLTAGLPYYGRGWLYLALSRLESKRFSPEGVTATDWDQIRPLIDKAYQQESGSAWMSYITGVAYLKYPQYLSPAEKQSALRRVDKGVSLVSFRYQRPAMHFLWKQFHDFKQIEKITPHDYPAYQRLIEFIGQQDLWQYAEHVYPNFLRLKKDEYEDHSAVGEKFFKRGYFTGAMTEFQKVLWMDQGFVRAQAGMMLSRQGAGLPLDQIETKLTAILEEEEESLGGLFEPLKKIVMDTSDPYLMGLYFYRTKNYVRAKDFLEQANPQRKFQRRYLAASYFAAGDKNKAISILEPALEEENPDARDLFLLNDWKGGNDPTVREKIHKNVVLKRPARAWWGRDSAKNVLEGKGSVGMLLNLPPGEVTLRVLLRNHSGRTTKPFGYVRFRMKNRVIATACARRGTWRFVTAKMATSGGKRWLEAELLNEMRAGDVSAELGDLEIRTRS